MFMLWVASEVKNSKLNYTVRRLYDIHTYTYTYVLITVGEWINALPFRGKFK